MYHVEVLNQWHPGWPVADAAVRAAVLVAGGVEDETLEDADYRLILAGDAGEAANCFNDLMQGMETECSPGALIELKALLGESWAEMAAVRAA